ncbi:hypothetical protein ACPUEN_16200 [Algoriphagus yeomjeoni]|uniref:hypothetical protein n=1 Tax=Algoriphagus yeomjeoni TaxID=291403 RepID=UPI003CE47D46
MKTLTLKLLALVTSAMLLGACSQMATYENEDLLLEQEVAAKNGFKLIPYGTAGNEKARTYASTDCVDFCIDPENPEYSVKTAQISNNSGSQTRVFTYSVHNTLAGFELNWNYSATNNAARKLRIKVSGVSNKGFASEKTYTSLAVQTNGSGSNTFVFDASWAACDVVTIKAEILEDDIVIVGPETTTYSLIGECVIGCDDESFDYSSSVEQGLVDVTFEYSYSEEAEVSIDFTFPQIINDIPTNGSYTGADGKIYRVTGNGTVFHWTGDVSCSSDSPTTFAFEGLVPDCGAGNANDGKANIWTDTKVVAINGVALVDDLLTLDINEGPYSLKGENTNIVYLGCPIN